MPKYVAAKAYRGLEGHVRRGAILDPTDFPSLTKERVESLKRNGLLSDLKDSNVAAPPAGMKERTDPPGMTSPNAAGMTHLGWTPGDGADGNADMTEGRFAGNGPAPEATAPAGSPDGTITSSSLSPRAQAPAKQTSPVTAEGRPKRGRRSAS